MKQLCLTCLVVLLLSSSLSSVEFEKKKHAVGFYAPAYGRMQFNSENQLEKVTGINILLGYTKKKYFYPVELNEFNPFWHGGTFALIIPYIGIGTEYIKDNGFFVSFHTVYILPLFNIGMYF